ncbi:MAG: Fic family protein [Candidatus Aenigmarchaeota archaeon]|nr:Fic family protein [Candidatus Aenigmarchaeota archaeon]
MRVVQRNRGARTYFYLQYSFRKDGHVVTREKYLGLHIPENMEIIKEEVLKEMKRHVYSDLENIKARFQQEWQGLPETVKENQKHEIAIAFTYNTNAIEGSIITLKDAREIIAEGIAPAKPLRDIKETESHASVFLRMLGENNDIDEQLLIKWHKDLFLPTKPDIAGIFRNYLIRVGSYVAPDWQDVKELMRELIRFIRMSSGNPVEHAARVHYRFEKIHPFGDGNGRLGRLLMNCMLWRAGYPMLIIEYRKRRAYYAALEKDEEGFVKYFMRMYLKAFKKLTGKAQ